MVCPPFIGKQHRRSQALVTKSVLMFSTAPLTAFMELSTAFSVRSIFWARFSFEPDHAVLCSTKLPLSSACQLSRHFVGGFQLYLAYLGSDPGAYTNFMAALNHCTSMSQRAAIALVSRKRTLPPKAIAARQSRC